MTGSVYVDNPRPGDTSVRVTLFEEIVWPQPRHVKEQVDRGPVESTAGGYK
jgi:hypothetical protein